MSSTSIATSAEAARRAYEPVETMISKHPADDFELHLRDSGAGDTVLLLHSSGMSGEQWRRTAASLAEHGYRAVVPDLLGSGRSPAWPDGKPLTFHDAYQALAVPTLLVTGEASPLAEQRVVARLGDAIGNARVETIASAGHMGPLTHAHAFHDLLTAQLSIR